MSVRSMEPYAKPDRTPLAGGAKPVVDAALHGALHLQPGAQGGDSLAEMAQRDLDAALQLLADRAQYITGATGAAIALRRDGKKDMLCRASSGANAPELGALLSTEFGLSGESVRTRQPLRCDDAERDLRVNRDVCREMGIASVVVMPVVNDDEVLGVFELFSGHANAFGARDLSAVQRLSEMVETAVRLAHAAETLPERLKMTETLAPEMEPAEVGEVQAPEVRTPQAQLDKAQSVEAEASEVELLEDHPAEGQIVAGQLLADIVLDDVLEDPIPAVPVLEDSVMEFVSANAATTKVAEPSRDVSPAPPTVETTTAAPVEERTTPKKTLFWSAAMNPAADAGTPAELDQSHVPPMLRSLRKCEACGFPVSAGRALCVECEEKKWRGQLRVPKAGGPRSTTMPAERSAASVKPEARAFAAAAQTTAAAGSASTLSAPVAVPASSGAITALPARKDDRAITAAPIENVAPRGNKSAPTEPASSVQTPSLSAQTALAKPSSVQPAKVAAPEFVFSAGLAPSQSWLATYKYIVGVLLVVGGAAAAFFLLR